MKNFILFIALVCITNVYRAKSNTKPSVTVVKCEYTDNTMTCNKGGHHE